MKLPVLYRRRSLVVPTLSGVLLILVALGLSVYYMFQNVATFLALSEPVGADYLVIEGWLGKNELQQANKIFDSGGYKFAIVSGGPIIDEFNLGPSNYAERAGKYLLSLGFSEQKIAIVPAPHSAQDRTFLSAVMIRDWFSSQNINLRSLDVFSADVHSRRTRDLYRLAFGDQVEVGIYAGEPDEFELSRWWQSSDAAKSVTAELLGWLMVKCCFEAGGRGSHFEKWGIDKSAANRMSGLADRGTCLRVPVAAGADVNVFGKGSSSSQTHAVSGDYAAAVALLRGAGARQQIPSQAVHRANASL